jgi:hypothetical protein
MASRLNDERRNGMSLGRRGALADQCERQETGSSISTPRCRSRSGPRIAAYSPDGAEMPRPQPDGGAACPRQRLHRRHPGTAYRPAPPGVLR